MGLVDYIILAVILLVVVLAGLYIYKASKNGQKCIGCPYSKSCGGRCKER